MRRVYFSYLHKSIINNYNVCCSSIKGEKDISRGDLKKFSSLLELNAVRASIETSLYRQAILKIITDVKNDTLNHKIHNKLAVYLDTPPKTVDAAVQTCFEDEIIKNNFNFSKNADNINNNLNKQDNNDSCQIFDSRLSEELKINNLKSTGREQRVEQDGGFENKDEGMEVKNNINEIEDKINKNIIDVFGNSVSNDDDNIGDDDTTCQDIQNIDEDTHDTLVQHLESMFCESDDSSDLMALIEKHSGVNKASIDMEVNKLIKTNSSSNVNNSSSNLNINGNSNGSSNKLDRNKVKKKELEVNEAGKRKVSFTDYQKMKKRSLDGSNRVEEKEDKQTKKMRGVWLVERIHQVSKLRAKMLELSVRNYRKHGRLRDKFQELFGDDEDEMMPESPVHIEEHLNACKERIAPWVVKYLMPYYEKKINGNKLLFKIVAKHVSDKLILENTFPGKFV